MEIACVASTFINSANPDTNYSSETYLESYYFLGTEMRSLVGFDLSAIPAGSTITSASVKLYVTDWTTNQGHTFARLTQNNWTEGATYNKYDGSNDWTTAGGDYTSDYSAEAYPDEIVDNWLSWNVMDMVQYALDNVGALNGIIKVSGTPFLQDLVMVSINGSSSQRPKLEVTYTSGGAIERIFTSIIS